MALPFGYKILPGIPTAPPPQGYNYAPGLDGTWYSYPTGQDNSLLSSAVVNNTSNGWFSGLPALPAVPDFLSGVLDYQKQYEQTFPQNENATIDPKTGKITGLAGSGGGMFDINYPRWGSIIVGALFIAFGLFGLVGGNGRQIIQLVQPTKP